MLLTSQGAFPLAAHGLDQSTDGSVPLVQSGAPDDHSEAAYLENRWLRQTQNVGSPA